MTTRKQIIRGRTTRVTRSLAAAAAVAIAGTLCGACGVAPWGAFAPPTDLDMPPDQSRQSPTDDTTVPGVSPECPESGVAISAGAADAAMGLRVQQVTVFNCGAEPYEVNGYPGVSILDAGLETLDVAINHGTSSIESPAPASIVLAPGDMAMSTLVWRNTVTTMDHSQIMEGAFVEIAPAAGEPAQIIKPEYPLDLGNTGELDVTAWSRP